MAQKENLTVNVKVDGIPQFKALVGALGEWLIESEQKDDLTPAEQNLRQAVVDLMDA